MKNLFKLIALAVAILLPVQGWPADTKISAMTSKGTPVAADTTVIVDSVGGANKKITLGSIPDLPLAGGTLTGDLALSPGNLTFTGLGAPASAPTLTLITISGQNVTTGSHKVVITYATASGETPASSASGAVTADGTHTELLVTFNDTAPAGATYRNVYLSKQGTTTPLYYVAQVAVATGTYTINTADGSLPATVPPTTDTTAGQITGANVASLQSSTPGTQQTGNLNISGKGIFGGDISGGNNAYLPDTGTMYFGSAASGNSINGGSAGGGFVSAIVAGGIIGKFSSIGITVLATYSNVVTGSPVLVSSTGAFGVASSSEKYKSLIQPLSNTEWLYKLQPKEYYYKWDKDWVKQYGLIAEDVAKIKPEMVFNDKDGKPDRVRYEQLIPWLLKAVQEQQAEIVALQGQVKELKKGN